MAKVVRLFCASCNPQDFYRPDRRSPPGEGTWGTLLLFVEQRRRTDRRRGPDRRVADLLPAGLTDRRVMIRGRRFRDGYAWFEGCVEEAIHAHWQVDWCDEACDADAPALVLCPKCRNKIR
ncbi:MAG: hypothetical protein H7838_05870 [Magnetococcus sp. DMHC-8]